MNDYSDIDCILRLAFGRSVPVNPIPLPPGQSERGLAFALHDTRLPSHVFLMRYSPQHQSRAFCAFTMMRALRGLNYCAPEVYYFGWSIHNRYIYLLVEYIEGRSIEGQPHAFFARINPSFAHTLAQLHHLTWDTLPDIGMRPLQYVFNDLTRQVIDLQTPELLKILVWLEARVDRIREQRHTVLHGDYILDNVLADYTQVVGVLGWENAVLGDPRFDIGHTSATLGAFGVALSDQFLDAYQAAPIKDIVFWEVLAALRLLTGIAATMAGIHASQLAAMQEQAMPVWVGLLGFVMHRTGLEF